MRSRGGVAVEWLVQRHSSEIVLRPDANSPYPPRSAPRDRPERSSRTTAPPPRSQCRDLAPRENGRSRRRGTQPFARRPRRPSSPRRWFAMSRPSSAHRVPLACAASRARTSRRRRRAARAVSTRRPRPSAGRRAAATRGDGKGGRRSRAGRRSRRRKPGAGGNGQRARPTEAEPDDGGQPSVGTLLPPLT